MDYETDDYKVRQYKDVTVVRFKTPNLTGVLEINRINEEIKAMVEGGKVRKLVICFKHVEHAGSAALGMLIGLNKRLKELKGKLIVSHPEQIEELLRVSKTNSMFTLAPDPKEALEMF